MKIVLATDGSEHSKAAVEEIAARPFPPHTQLRIISVFESTFLTVSQPATMGGLAGYYEEADAVAKQLAEDTIRIASEIIKEKNPALSISIKVINDSPKQAILKEAEAFGADLIVVGSQGLGTFSRFLLGSVSQSVALHAPCSVLIVRKQEVKNENKKKELA
jgi:nucleotide-binding universal stress UspA family protein